MTKTDERYIANSASAWGSAYTEYQALANWASNSGVAPGDTVKVDVAEVTGPVRLGPGVIKPVNDETELDATTYEVSGDDVRALAEAAGETELRAETVLVNADEVDAD